MPALEASAVLHATLALVLGVGWRGTQRAATTGNRSSGRSAGLGRLPLFDPIHRSAQHIEGIECSVAATAKALHTAVYRIALHGGLVALRINSPCVVIAGERGQGREERYGQLR